MAKNYNIGEHDMKLLLDEYLLNIYEISMALQEIPTKNHLEKLDHIELGDMLEMNYDKASKILTNNIDKDKLCSIYQ